MSGIPALICHLYNEFTSIGIDGKSADFRVTDTLECVPKPNKVIRALEQVYGKRAPLPTANTKFAPILAKLTTIVAESPKESDLRAQATFVKSVLEILLLRRDPGLKNLALLNRICRLFTTATEQDKANLALPVKQLTQSYLAKGSFDNAAECTEILKKLKISGAGPWQFVLPSDLVAILFTHLSLKDLLSASSSCKRWRELATRDEVSHSLCGKVESCAYISSLIRTAAPLIEDVRANRCKICDFKKRKIFETFADTMPTNIEGFTISDGLDEAIIYDNLGFQVFKRDGSKTVFPHDLGDQQNIIILHGKGKWYAVCGLNLRTLQSIHEIDTTTGTLRLIHTPSPNVTFAYATYYDNKIYVMLNTLYVLDLATNRATQLEPRLPSGPTVCCTSRYFVVRGASGHMQIQDLSDLTAPPIVVANSQEYFERAVTSTVLYVSDHAESSIKAIDLATGRMVCSWAHDPLPADRIPKVRVSNGMLYVSIRDREILVYDLLTTKLVRSIDLLLDCNPTYTVLANKILYTRGPGTRTLFGGHPIQKIDME